MHNCRAMRTDVLIIGGGGAALRAAIAACEVDPQLDVTLVTKGRLGASGVTATACSDRMAFHATLPGTLPGGPDAWRYHARDIYEIGGQVSDADLAEILARHSAEAFAYLDGLGVPWARRSDGTVDQFLTDGSVYPRACYTGPYTANHIEAALLARLAQLRAHVLEHHMAAELLLSGDGQVAGALLISELDDAVTVMNAGAVVLATGGAGQVFAENVFPPDCTGDGYAMAYRAGAELVNMEFIQIGLCSTSTGLACSGSMMRAIPRLINEDGHEFLEDYLLDLSPQERCALVFAKGASWPVSQRDPSHRIDIAVAQERRAGHHVYLDYSRNPADLDLQALPEHIGLWYDREKGLPVGGSEMMTPLARLRAINLPSVRWLADHGVDLAGGDLVEIAPAAQHYQGGVKIRLRAEASLPGLYAAGEAAGGQHGANRPGGNALLDSQVFGRIAGESAALHALTCRARAAGDAANAHDSIARLFRPAGRPAGEVLSQVQRSMSAACGVHRTAAGLRGLMDELATLQREGMQPHGVTLSRAVEAVNVLQVAQLVVQAAFLRDESRGPHLRFESESSLEPLPRDDRRWNRYIVISRSACGPLAEPREPVRPGKAEWHTGED